MPAYLMNQTNLGADCGPVAMCSGQGLAKIAVDVEAAQGAVPGPTETFVTLFLSSTTDAGFMTQSIANEPGVTTWQAGTWITRLNVTTGQIAVTLEEVHICRVNSACVNQASVGSELLLGVNLSLPTIVTVNIDGSVQAAAVDDQIYIVWVFTNTAEIDRNIGITPDQTIDTPIDIAGAVLVPRPIHRHSAVELYPNPVLSYFRKRFQPQLVRSRCA